MHERIHLTATSKGFKKAIGTYLHADGKPRPMIWWFGADTNKSAAEEMAQLVKSAWRYLQEAGVPYPKAETLDEQLAAIFGKSEPKPPAKSTHWTPDAITSVKAGLARLKSRIPVRIHHAEQVLFRYGTTYNIKVDKDGWKDRPLDYGYNQIRQVTKNVSGVDTLVHEKLPILDAAGLKIGKPWPLDGAGKAKPSATDTPPALEFLPYGAASWAELNLF